MQPPTDGPRGGFSVDQVQYLIENSSSLETGMGLELITQNLDLVADISDDLREATVARNSFANLHATLTFTYDSELDWGNSIVRPYFTMTGQTAAGSALASMKFYLGAYITDTPKDDLSETADSYDATGYDILSMLDDAVGDSYSVDAGVAYLDQVESILQARGFTQYIIDRDQSAAVLASSKAYAMDDNYTWLTIINDLLSSVGYAGIWSDHNGTLHAQLYESPAARGPEWLMTDSVDTTLLTQRRTRQRDFYSTPNRWVFYRNTSTENDQPSSSNGLRYEYVFASGGPTSVEARGGRTITKVVGVDAPDSATLQAQAQITIDADTIVPLTIAIDTAPFPLAWHMDRIEISDARLGASLQVLATSWRLSLDGSDMSWEWTALE